MFQNAEIMASVLIILVVIFELTFATSPNPSKNDLSYLKVNELYETTNWDLLEDLYLYFNAIRYFHDSSDLRFNRTLTDYARVKALIFAWYDGNVPADNGNIKFGETVHWYPSSEVEVNGSDIIEDWYFREEPKWDYDNPRLAPETSDFSQIVWNSTHCFGCGQAVSKGQRGGTYTVCFFDPPGNVEGQEKENVFRSPYMEPEEGDEEEESSTSDSATEATSATTEAPAGKDMINEVVMERKAEGRRYLHPNIL